MASHNKLDETTRAAVLAAYIAGESTSSIARRFGLSKAHPRKIAKRAGIAARAGKTPSREWYHRKLERQRTKRKRVVVTAYNHDIDWLWCRDEPPPTYLWRELDYRLSLIRSLTPSQILLGDPMPGRSMLDKRLGRHWTNEFKRHHRHARSPGLAQVHA